MYALDGLALFFKRFFLLAALIVLLMSVEFADRIASRHRRVLCADPVCAGRACSSPPRRTISPCCSCRSNSSPSPSMCSPASSAAESASLEAGVKYLIIGALSTAFTVFGIALVYGISHTLNFGRVGRGGGAVGGNPIFLFGLRAGPGGARVQDRRLSLPDLGARMSIRARRRRRRPSWPSAPRRRALSCCCACCSLPCRTSPPTGRTC